jgi:N-carbamoylputrescine amidase
MKDQVKITLVQLSDDENAERAVERMPRYFDIASEYGSDLVVFPEYVLGRHVTVEDRNVQRFLAMTKEHGLYSIAGLVENHGSRFATTALMVDRSGTILGRYLKSHPASGKLPHYWPPVDGGGDEAWGILGNQFKVFHLDFGPVGILQCYDGYFPEAWGCTSYLGAEVVLWINGRGDGIEDFFCMSAAHAYGCVVGANVSNGHNTGFAEPRQGCISAEGEPEEARLFPRIRTRGDACVSATIDLKRLRWWRKHLRQMHQRRPEMYGLLTQPITMWQDYPDVAWDSPDCEKLVNKAQL